MAWADVLLPLWGEAWHPRYGSVCGQSEDAIIGAGRTLRHFPNGRKHNRQPGKREGSYKRKKKGGWTCKHLRNIGGKKRHGIGKDERDHFLGHVDPTQTRWYTGDEDETYLLPLVNMIAAQYVDDE